VNESSASAPLWREIVRWSALTAAFIGPGTVTMAARAGAESGWLLIPVVLAAGLACYLAQYTSAMITMGSGLPILEAMRQLPGGSYMRPLLVVLIIAGCMAFEAGNLTGAASGIELLTGAHYGWLPLFCAVAAALMLYSGNSFIRISLGMMVFAMAVFFFLAAIPVVGNGITTKPFPPNGLMLALGLFGTTLVPYNIFMGSALAKGASQERLPTALAVSIGTGVFITLVILISGTAISGGFTFAALYDHMLGLPGGTLAAKAVATGLFAAGFSSAITAPFAASVLFPEQSSGRKLVPMLVLLAGVGGAISGGTPVAIITFAQVANALVLPAALGALSLLSFRVLASFYLAMANGILALVFLGLSIRWFWVTF
jgi:Mn2+/Fe2+ NRAMP family transporter